jgi:hypothetical protein
LVLLFHEPKHPVKVIRMVTKSVNARFDLHL